VRAAQFVFSLSIALVLGGCGYVGPVQPPSPEIPAQVRDLVAVERGDKIEIVFHTPPRTTDSLAIKRFSDIDLRIGPALVPFDFESWAETAKQHPVNPPPPGDAFDPKPIPITMSLPLEGWVGQRVAVAVRTSVRRGNDHFSAWSNRVELDVVRPVPAPSNAKATESVDGVVLDWSAVESAERYRVLRQSPADKNPLELGSSETPHYVDTASQFDVPYSYQIVALNKGAESLPSEALKITPIDKFPPSVPSGVAALAGPESIEVSWQRSSEADTAGYYVYRSVNGSEFERQGDIVTLPAFSDRKVEHGKTYRYQISSVDQKQNESAKSPPMDVVF